MPEEAILSTSNQSEAIATLQRVMSMCSQKYPKADFKQKLKEGNITHVWLGVSGLSRAFPKQTSKILPRADHVRLRDLTTDRRVSEVA